MTMPPPAMAAAPEQEAAVPPATLIQRAIGLIVTSMEPTPELKEAVDMMTQAFYALGGQDSPMEEEAPGPEMPPPPPAAAGVMR